MTHVLVSVGQRALVAVLATAGIAALASSSAGRSDLADNIRLVKNGDTHITQYGLVTTIDCSDSTVFVNGSQNVITALGSCYAISVQGSSNTIIADNVVNDITVYGFNQKVLYKSGEPAVIDRGRELGMMNFIDRIPG
ncbi:MULTISPECIES: DUF3060 domain-containing protein [Mycobacteroides]|uniref:DUF3060 domain-containing protein n=1 Tax=Mycobacteroides chelonae TaxID=1774 RepID=A0A1S1LMJ8_MYCCH|nr:MULTISPECIES: DUF3060 domain-containing protein [Mycobacteroides]KRQ19435.1 hypothetical protein AOT87_21935 [Mycobacteroides sp. H003]KRQ29460.1 hypothetical protein AOT91_16470 [Mycobacteroides sp. H092]KRQ42068.1 hypothetical protein AOT92_10825 [Mycobacteroides sp. H101]KRQ50349.1 hypothetical protein AOT88_08735 [Mycobacteroides sp. H063]KRQ56605.1 hypothetical protein AOT94_20475 [Mycobacteroides sp. HXVII]